MLFHSSALVLAKRFVREAKRYFYITPTLYLELLNGYKRLYAERHAAVSAAKTRYENGLNKLLFTEGQVNTMKAALEVLKPQLVQASKDTDELLVNVEHETVEADKVKAVVSVDEKKAKGEADKVTAIKEECEVDLAEAMPALNAAIKALDTLTKNDITEVKGMKSPPAAVKMVLEAVCIIKGLKATKVLMLAVVIDILVMAVAKHVRKPSKGGSFISVYTAVKTPMTSNAHCHVFAHPITT
jgi:dynein heavy chain, axonemal